MIFFLFLIGSAYAADCEAGWSNFGNNCCKHIYDPNRLISFGQAETECSQRGAYLTTAELPEELNFVTDLASRLGDWSSHVDAMKAFPVLPQLRVFAIAQYSWQDALMIGGMRDINKKWSWPKSNSTWFYWCKPTEPTLWDPENCLFIFKQGEGQSCLYDTGCDPVANAHYHYVCKKSAISCKEGAEIKEDGKCGCKKGYFDITETDCPERREHKKAEMCISRTPCQNVTEKESLSIVFVVDSSQSIGASNWKNMVRFLKSGSKLLDNSIDVGFVQFSTDVTYSDWLPKRWDKDDYLDQTPSKFDAGYTNTPAALEEALKMFKKDRSRHQVAVLITDGMPYVEDILPKEEAMDKTIEAAKKLRRAGVELVALGYGKELQKQQSYLKEILEKPRRDYFEYDKEAGDLKDIHMTVLLNKVCSRF